MRTKIAIPLPEDIYIPPTTMERYAKLTSPFYINFNQEQLIQYMADFEIDYKQKLTTMSLGQKKKAMIAFALACNTNVLLMDEPTNGLDIPSKAQFRKIISTIADENRCIIISTHQVKDLENLIDSIVIIEENEIIASASTEHIEKCLLFKLIAQDEQTIYEESSVRGRWGVVENKEGIDNKIDIELFFNAAINNTKLIQKLLQAK